MKLKYFFLLCAMTVGFVSCGDDDDGAPQGVPPRDQGEQAIEDDALLREYLSTHFYNYEAFANPPADFDYQIRFDTIAFENSDKIPLLDQVTSTTINRFGADQTFYTLKAREGAGVNTEGDELYVPTIADSVFIRYTGTLLYRYDDTDQDGIPDFADADAEENAGQMDDDGDGIVNAHDAFDNVAGEAVPGVVDADNDGIIDNSMGIFDATPTPVWFDLANGIEGFSNGLAGTKAGSGLMVAPDGTITSNNDYAIGAIFIPSGLAYFNSPPTTTIGLYSSLIFTFDHYRAIKTDHDDDGIPSIMEDVNNNGFLYDEVDNTDGDLSFNFRDADDDEDRVETTLEINFRMEMIDGEEVMVFDSFKDTDGDGTPDHLDTDDDGDGRDTSSEIRINSNTGEVVLFDSDADGIPDYLDPDS